MWYDPGPQKQPILMVNFFWNWDLTFIWKLNKLSIDVWFMMGQHLAEKQLFENLE